MSRMRLFVLASLAVFGSFLAAVPAQAAALTFVSDLISTSIPATGSDHTITFTVTNAVPAGGKISVAFEAVYFDFQAALNYTDMDLLVDGSQRTLGSAADAGTDGVTVTSGSVAPGIVITLNSTTGISAGQDVELRIGQNAVSGTSGDQRISNPPAERPYRIIIQTKDAADILIDAAQTKVMVISPVTVGPIDTIDSSPPTRSNGLPSGALAAGITQVEISLNTSEDSECRYSTTADTLYASMVNLFSSSGDNKLHSTAVGPVSNGNTYAYYVRCEDVQDNENTTDFTITFSIKSSPPEGTIPGPVGGPEGAGGAQPGGNGGQPYPLGTAGIEFRGWAYPLSRVTILKDGKIDSSVTAAQDGSFDAILSGLVFGKYTFTLYAQDANGNRSANYSVTEALIGGTNNEVFGIFLTPTIKLGENIDAQGKLTVSGYSLAKGNVDVWLYRPASQVLDSEIIKKTASASATGFWTTEFDRSSFSSSKSSVVQARSVRNITEKSSFTTPLSVTLSGESVEVEEVAKGSDLNGDGKINLIDFSILIFNWGTPSDPAADLNGDGIVNLTDFSILIFNWTG